MKVILTIESRLERINAIYCIIVLLLFSMFFVSSLSSQTVVQMTRSGGVSLIPCKVNGLNLNFVFDTGASDVSLSLTEAGFMLKNGYLAESDFVGTQNYSDANGDIEEGVVINLRSIIIGGLLIKNVQATIVKNTKAPLLLGQSALSRLGIVQQDFVKNTLTIYNNGSVPKAPLASVPPKPVTNKSEIVITDEDGDITKFSIVPLSRIATKPKPNIKYFWYNQDNNSFESTVGEWGGPLVNGKYLKYYSNGNLAEIGVFVNGVRNGEFKVWLQNGEFDRSTIFLNDEKKSISIRYNRIVYDAEWNETMSGYKIVKSNPKVKQDVISTYYDGAGKLYRKEIGVWPLKIIEYWPNGNERRHFTLHCGTQTRVGEYVEFFENGKIRVKGNYHHKDYPRNTPVGTWRFYNMDGTLNYPVIFSMDTIKNDDTTFIGTTVKYYSNGEKERIADWKMKVEGNEEYDWLSYTEKYWNPENAVNSEYPRFLAPYFQTYNEDYDVAEMCFRLDDYSINYYRHKFEGDD